VSLGKSDGLVSQTGVSNFGRTEAKLVEEDDCSISSFNNDDDASDDEVNNQVLLDELTNSLASI
jgi:hypothetical protein